MVENPSHNALFGQSAFTATPAGDSPVGVFLIIVNIVFSFFFSFLFYDFEK